MPRPADMHGMAASPAADLGAANGLPLFPPHFLKLSLQLPVSPLSCNIL